MLDLFSGIGGFSLAASWTGRIETVAFCEIEPYCQKVLKKHWPDVPIHDDIRTLRGEDVGTVDIVCGGFPCQDVSCANPKGKGLHGEMSGLWSEFSRIICEIRPQYAVVENVPRLLKFGFNQVIGDLAQIGYDAEWQCIPAAAFGAPHLRERVWIVAYPCGKPELQAHTVFSTVRSQWETRDNACWSLGQPVPGTYWAVHKSPFPGVDDGISDRLVRVALGNAIVPQVVYPIFQAIVDIEEGRA